MPTRRVSPQEARTMMEQEGFRYVDVRSTAEFTAGHPSESYNVPVANSGPGGMTPNPDFVAVMEASFPHDAKLVIGCMAGGRSARACAMLEQAGYTQIVDQRAGFDGARDNMGQILEAGWSRAGLPVETGAGGDLSYEALVKNRA